jgi:quinoprotein dehydrogenase-associated probable ABC transporter substrate-binding protein
MKTVRLLAGAVVLGLCADAASAQTPSRGDAARLREGTPSRRDAPPLRVCADPQNMPFSNDRFEGFENKIADLVAGELGTTTRYVWWGQRRGFVRNTMNATLAEGRCDVMVTVPAGYDLVRTTTPYFRSSYVFVFPKDKGPRFASLDDAALKTARIGVHLLGDDYTNPPPVHELSKRGIAGRNVVGFSTFYSSENPPDTLVNAVASGKVDVAIVWGPAAGLFVKRQKAPLAMVPVPSKPGDLPFQFDISMGVKRGDEALRASLERVLAARRADILKILDDYGVPLVGQPGRKVR